MAEIPEYNKIDSEKDTINVMEAKIDAIKKQREKEAAEESEKKRRRIIVNNQNTRTGVLV